MPVPTLHRKCGYEDYRRTPDDERYELLDGELIMVPAPRVDHQRVVLRLRVSCIRSIWRGTRRGLSAAGQPSSRKAPTTVPAMPTSAPTMAPAWTSIAR